MQAARAGPPVARRGAQNLNDRKEAGPGSHKEASVLGRAVGTVGSVETVGAIAYSSLLLSAQVPRRPLSRQLSDERVCDS